MAKARVYVFDVRTRYGSALPYIQDTIFGIGKEIRNVASYKRPMLAYKPMRNNQYATIVCNCVA